MSLKPEDVIFQRVAGRKIAHYEVVRTTKTQAIAKMTWSAFIGIPSREVLHRFRIQIDSSGYVRSVGDQARNVVYELKAPQSADA